MGALNLFNCPKTLLGTHKKVFFFSSRPLRGRGVEPLNKPGKKGQKEILTTKVGGGGVGTRTF